MKKNIFISALLVLVGFMTSCSSDDSADTPTNVGSTISATINGQSWSSIQGAAIASITTLDSQSESIIQIVGAKLDQSVLTVQLPLSSVAEGTYNFGTNDDGMLTYFNPTNMSMYTSDAGTGSFTLTITSFDLNTGKLSGTFSGTLFSDDLSSMTVSNGVIDNVNIISNQLYSNGSMSLKRGNGQIFTMDIDKSDSKFLLISQNSVNNQIVITGYNMVVGNDFGIYSITLPKTATVGNHNFVANSSYDATIGSSDNEPQYNVTSGSVNVTSHSGTNLVGTFNFTVSNGNGVPVTISSGAFNITHK